MAGASAFDVHGIQTQSHSRLAHDPEKCVAVFRKDHARTQMGSSAMMVHPQLYPCTIAFSIMQWMPLEPLTAWVTRKSAARLHSV